MKLFNERHARGRGGGDPSFTRDRSQTRVFMGFTCPKASGSSISCFFSDTFQISVLFRVRPPSQTLSKRLQIYAAVNKFGRNLPGGFREYPGVCIRGVSRLKRSEARQFCGNAFPEVYWHTYFRGNEAHLGVKRSTQQ